MLKKVKNWLGIEGVKVELLVPEEFSLKSEQVAGKILVSTQSEQFVEDATITLKERYKRGRRKSKLIDEYTIGTLIIPINQVVSPDVELEKEFELGFHQLKTPIEKWGDRNFLYKGLSKLAKIAKNAHSTFEIIVELNVKGNRLKPYEKRVLVVG